MGGMSRVSHSQTEALLEPITTFQVLPLTLLSFILFLRPAPLHLLNS